MRIEAPRPVFVNNPTLPKNIRTRTATADRLDLSTSEQVVSLPKAGLAIRKRFNRMKRVVIGAGEQNQASLQRQKFRYRAAMITMTYRPGQHWEPKDISRCMDHYRQWLRKRGHRLQAVWTMELQKRGAPHYHMVIWLPRGITPPKPDKAGWWKKGATNCTWARRPVGYLAKYASKGFGDGKDLPHGARLYGIYGCPVPLGWWRAPSWLREIAAAGMKITYRPGGWWCVPALATAWRSPWRLLSITAAVIEIEWRGWREMDVRSLWELEATETFRPVSLT